MGPRPFLTALILVPFLVACSSAPDDAEHREEAPARAESQPSIPATLAQLPEFSLLRRALTDSDRQAVLRGAGPFTLLAPRDTAFAQLSPDQRDALFAPQNRAALTRAIDQLILPVALRGPELRRMIADGGGSVTIASRAGPLSFSLSGEELVVTTPSGAKATMGTQETGASNGMFYVLDHWLGDPPPATAALPAPAANTPTAATAR